MTSKNSKTAKTAKTSKKSKLTAAEKAERKEAAKARRVEIIRLKTERHTLLEEMANAVMLGDLNNDQIVALGEATRRDVAAVDAALAELRIRRIKRSAPKGFKEVKDEDGTISYVIDIDGLTGRVSGTVATVIAEEQFAWTVIYGAEGTGAVVTGQAKNLKLAVAMCKATVLAAKRDLNKRDAK